MAVTRFGAPTGLERPARRPDRKAVAVEAGVILAAVIWAVFLTWPLALHAASAAPYNLGDPLENAWIFGWGAHAVVEQPLALFHANMFFPSDHSLAFAENMLGLSVPLAPLFWVTGNAVLSANVAAIAVTAAAGYAVHRLVLGLTRSRSAAVVAAAAFVATPQRLALLDHIHVLAIHLLPFVLLVLIGLTRRPSWWRAGALALLVGVQFWSSLTGGILTLVAIGTWSVWTLAVRRRHALPALAMGVGATVLGLALAAPVLVTYRQARAENPEYAHPEVEVLEGSATPGSFAYPPPGGPTVRALYRSLAEDNRGSSSPEETLFPGLVLSVGGAVGLVAAVAVRGDQERRRHALLAVLLGLAGAALSFGPRWGGREDGLPLPFFVVSELVPGGLTRVPARIGALVPLALAIALGLGLAAASRRARAVLAAAVLTLLVVEGWPSRVSLVDVPEITAAHRDLARGDGPVLALPTVEYDAEGTLLFPSVFREATHLYFSTVHFRPLVNGYGAFLPASYVDLARKVQDFPSVAGMAALADAGVGTVVVERSLTEGSRWAGVDERLAAWPGVVVVSRSGKTTVFDVRAAAR